MANKHLFKLWLTTLLLAPIVYTVFMVLINVDGQILSLLEVLPMILFFSFFFSLPTLFLTYLVNKFIVRKNLIKTSHKTINGLVSTLGIVCTLLIINGSLKPSIIFYFIIIYIISLGISMITIEICSNSSKAE